MKTHLTFRLLLTALLAAPLAEAAVTWTGDFETGNLDQWGYVLNEDGIQLVGDPVLGGSNAALITLTNQDTWPNGLHRVELQHAPEAARTAEGAELYFAWSFYLPDALPSSPSQQIGYWESGQSYQQMMAFQASGSDLSFATRKPQNAVHWEGQGVLQENTWHRIAMQIRWSKDPSEGRVNVWFDGQPVVTDAAAQTLNDDNPHFTQVGLLRGQADFSDAPQIVIDHALEGESLADVAPPSAPDGGAGAGGAAGSAGSSTGGSSGSSAGSGGNGGSMPDAGNGGGNAGSSAGAGGSSPSSSGDDDGGCALSNQRAPSSGIAWIALALIAAWRSRKRVRSEAS